MFEGEERPEPTYRAYPFRLTWEGREVAGLSKVGALTGTLHAITMERGLTCDPAFVQWIKEGLADRSAVLDDAHGEDGSVRLRASGLRKDFTLEMYDETGQKVIAYHLRRCWPSAFVMLPDTSGIAVAFSMLRLEYESREAEAAR